MEANEEDARRWITLRTAADADVKDLDNVLLAGLMISIEEGCEARTLVMNQNSGFLDYWQVQHRFRKSWELHGLPVMSAALKHPFREGPTMSDVSSFEKLLRQYDQLNPGATDVFTSAMKASIICSNLKSGALLGRISTAVARHSNMPWHELNKVIETGVRHHTQGSIDMALGSLESDAEAADHRRADCNWLANVWIDNQDFLTEWWQNREDESLMAFGKGKGKGKSKGKPTCWQCGEPGHMSRECPSKGKGKSKGGYGGYGCGG